MTNIITFPKTRMTTLREIISCAGFAVGDTVQHLTYGWQGSIEAFDWYGDECRALVLTEFKGARTILPVRVELLMLQTATVTTIKPA